MALFIVVTLFCGFSGFVDVIAQPRHAFQAAGHSKALWLLIEFVGFVTLLGIVTLPIYALFIRRSVVRSGGVYRPGLAMKQGRARVGGASSQLGGGGATSCGACNGSGSRICDSCHGTGRVNGETHHACGGSGNLSCAMCNGSGHR